MRVKKMVVLFGLAMVFLFASSAFGSTPEPLYPSADMGVGITSNPCPIFGWVPVDQATGYEIAVFQHTTPEILSFENLNARYYPLISVTVDAPLTSWDCTNQGCFSDGTAYVWYVRAIYNNKEAGEWSSATVFEIDSLKGDPSGTEGDTNTIYGKNAGVSLTTGSWNTFIGAQAGRYNTSGENNAFIGFQAGKENTTGSNNSFHGANAGVANTTGGSNTFVGNAAGLSNTAGAANTFIGNVSGRSNSTASLNTFLGQGAGYTNTTGSQNTFVGQRAGYLNTTGGFNSFIGQSAGWNNTSGEHNSFVGQFAGYNNTTGTLNAFVGAASGSDNSTGSWNTFLGAVAGQSNITGGSNAFVGNATGYSNTTGSGNTFIGQRAGYKNTSGGANTYIGCLAGFEGSAGWQNVFIGHKAGYYETGSNKLYIANSDTNTPLVYGEFDNKFVRIYGKLETCMIQMTSGACCTSGGVWTNASSREYKKDIKPLSTEKAVDVLAQLNPVEFAYKIDTEDTHVGFIAEDVPDLVATKDRKGTSPMDVVAVLTKVVQEQQRAISELSKEVAELKKELRAKGSTTVAQLELRERSY